MTRRKKVILIFSCLLIITCIWFTFYYANGPQTDTVKFQDGSVYHGTTENGKLVSGVMKFKNDDTYTGTFKSGRFEGHGTYKSHEGWTFTGEFRHGAPQGQGQFTKKNRIIQSGTYDKGVHISNEN